MLTDSYFIFEHVIRAQADTELDSVELNNIVGRYPPDHKNRGRLRGRILIHENGAAIIVHDFTSVELWRSK